MSAGAGPQAQPLPVAEEFRAANALRRAGRHDEAVGAYRRVVERHPAFGAAWFNLGLSELDRGRRREAALALHAAWRCDPRDYEAAQALVDTVAAAVRSGEPLFARPGPAARPDSGALVSVVVCSIDAAKLARLRGSLAAAFGSRPHEVVAIPDARSLAEGFNRGIGASRGAIVVACHDDIEILSPDLGGCLDAALAQVDVAGLAGADRAGGPAVLWCGHPHLHGWVSYAAEGGGYDAAPLDFRAGLTHGLQTLDGLFVAMRREVAAKVPYDAEAFDGFHFYDLDFSYRAHLAGFRLGVTRDLLVVHDSRGSFDASWQRYAGRFAAKFPALSSPKGDPHWYNARLADRGALARFWGELAGLAGRAP